MKVEDLVVNDAFRRYIKFGENKSYWQNLSENDPILRENMHLAAALIREAGSPADVFPQMYDQAEVWDKIMLKRARSKSVLWWKIALAASVLLFCSLPLLKQPRVNYENLVENLPKTDVKEVINTTQDPMVVLLPDRSSVVLYTGSKLSYSQAGFNTEKREVYFSGEGFFEVTKDANRPFFVYANELITKVLGTSFTIKTSDSAENIEVIVKSGRVEVSTRKDPRKKEILSAKTLSSNHLVENQKIELNRSTLSLSPIAPLQRNELLHPVQQMNFHFEDSPLSKIISDLELAYHVKIYYDKEKWQNTKVTAHLSDEPLYDKIEMICKAIEARCTIRPNQIEIY